MSGRFVDDYLLFQLALASHTFSEEFYEQLRVVGVSASQWRILINLVDCTGMYLTALAKYALYEQSRVTKLVDILTAQGLVEKRSGSHDRRKVSVHITHEGRQLIEPLIEQAKIHEKSVLSVLSKNEQTRLKSILKKMATRHRQDLKVLDLKLVQTL